MPRPRVVAFDVIETTFALDGLRPRFAEAGLPPDWLELWFARTLRDAFALAVTGTYQPFRTVMEGALADLLAETGLAADPERIAAVLDGMRGLDPQPGAEAALERLRDAGVRAVALSNGGAVLVEHLFHRAGLGHLIEDVLTVDDAQALKPRAEVYAFAARRLSVEPADLALVACHPWDLHGAAGAGLTTAYVARGRPYPGIFRPPTVTGDGLDEAVEKLVALT